MNIEEKDKIHKFELAELFGNLDHKMRGIQQLILALCDIEENSSIKNSLKELMKSTKELQNIYNSLLKIRKLNMEDINIGKYINEVMDFSTDFSGYVYLDKEKFKFVLDSIVNLGGEDCTVNTDFNESEFFIIFKSHQFNKIYAEELNHPFKGLDEIRIYTVKKLAEKMNLDFKLVDGELRIKIPYLGS